MDSRVALCCGSKLDYETMHITVESEIGRGSNSIVYLGTYPDPITPGEKHVVLIKELFPLHQEGAIYRDNKNAIICKPEGEILFNTHKQSFLTGNEIHLKMLSKHPGAVVSNIISFYMNNTAYTLLDYTAGRSLEREMFAPERDLRRLAGRMLGLLRALEVFHDSGYLHLDIAADNTLLIGHGADERVVLIDYNSAWQFKNMETDISHCSSIKNGYSAPEVRTGHMDVICPATDLYSIAALFYRCISGCVLTPFQMMCATPPDISQYPCMIGQPLTVINQVCRIIFKGLQADPAHRYICCSEMEEAFRELIDRIDGRGISHWALWETGQRTVARMLKANTAMSYLRSVESLYPLYAESASGETRPVGEWIQNAVYLSGDNLMLSAPGGMGKTTAILRYIIENGRKYHANSPAYIYIPLKRFHKGDKNFITDSILENLHFQNEVSTYETARHALRELLSHGMNNKNTVLPSTVVFLDGLNEIRDEHQELFDEIGQLSQLPGVRIIITSRTYEPIDRFTELKIKALTEQTVQEQLSFNGLLMPQDKIMAELLKTPLMLSIFVQASKAEGKQLLIDSEEELMRVYFSSIMEKEINSLSQDDALRWQLEVAAEFVLPVLAVQTKNKGSALSNAELLGTVNRCYKIFSSSLLSRVFKQWIGHSKAIIGEAKSGEEWYGIIVHSLLWQRLGLLVRDENGCYSISHQILEEYLAQNGQSINQRIRSRRRLKTLIVSVPLLIFVAAGLVAYSVCFVPEPYDDHYMINILADTVNEYVHEGHRYVSLCELIESTDSTENFDLAYALYLEGQRRSTGNQFDWNEMVADMNTTGEICSWSGKPFDYLAYLDMRKEYSQRETDYERLTGLLHSIMHDPSLYDEYYESFIKQFKSIIETDAKISSAYFIKLCLPHLTDSFMKTSDGFQIGKILQNIPEQREYEYDYANDKLSTLRDRLSNMCTERDVLLKSQEINVVSERIKLRAKY